MESKLSQFKNQSEHAEAVYQLLLEFYGEVEWHSEMEPIDILIATILSQNTNDANRDKAYQALQRQFPTWEAVRDAPVEEVIEAIRPAGLANQKGPRLQEVLRSISALRGRLDLEFLENMSTEEARAWLMQFKGVGPKTAAIVLLFSFNKPAFPVDTHVYRVTGRLGLHPPGMSVEQTHLHLEHLFSPESYAAAHLNLIRLGREICQARRPLCEICPLTQICEYYQSKTGSESQ